MICVRYPNVSGCTIPLLASDHWLPSGQQWAIVSWDLETMLCAMLERLDDKYNSDRGICDMKWILKRR